MQILKRLYDHKIFLSVALSETGSVKGVHVRAIWPVAAAKVLLIAFICMVVMGTHGRAKMLATLAGDEKAKTYLSQIEQLEQERTAYSQQVQLIAQELGVLQARLARFDALGERLVDDEMLHDLIGKAENIPTGIESGQGGPEEIELDRIYSLDDVRQELGLLRKKADIAEMALEAGKSLAVRNQEGVNNAPYFYPVLHPRMYTSSSYGWRVHPITKRRHWHGGLDVAAGWDAPIVSAGDGVVIYAGYRYAFGIMVEIRHANGFTTRYAHMNKAAVKNGDAVKAGDLIGLMGSTGRSTGPHLHFEVLKDDESLNPYPFVRQHRTVAKRLAQEGRGAELVAEWKARTKQVASK